MKISDLAKELNLHHLKLVAARKKQFPESKGELDSSEVSFLRSYFSSRPDDKPTAEEEDELVVITNMGGNPTYIEGISKTNPRGRQLVLIPYMGKRNFKHGQTIKARWRSHKGRNCYVHTSILKRPDVKPCIK